MLEIIVALMLSFGVSSTPTAKTSKPVAAPETTVSSYGGVTPWIIGKNG